MAKLRVGQRFVGDGHPCYVIAEAGLNHNGDLDIAKKLIDVAAMSGCDCVKFQKRDVANLAIKEVLDAEDKRFPELGSTYREIREKLEFNFEQYEQLVAYCKERKIDFLCTPFDVKSVDFLEKLGVQAYKIASHNLTNLPLIEYVARIHKPMFLSTGMSTYEEIDETVKVLWKHKTPFALMHCMSIYPHPPKQANLAIMKELKRRYPDVPIGYSGHDLGYLATLSAVAKGACIVEKHITLSKKMVGFDHHFSLEPDELKQMVHDIREIDLTEGTSERTVKEQEWVTRRKYHASIVSAIDIEAGQVITQEMLTTKNPGTGLETRYIPSIVGKKAKIKILKDTLINFDMLE